MIQIPSDLPKPWVVKSTRYILRSYFDTIRADRCETPQGKLIDRYCTAEHPDWVNSFLITQDLQVVMIWQYRHAIGKVVVELPGGCIDPSDKGSVEIAARRESVEEVGYQDGNYTHLGVAYPNPATQNNQVHSTMLWGGVMTGVTDREATEDIVVQRWDIDKLFAEVDNPRSKFIFPVMHKSSVQSAREHIRTASDPKLTKVGIELGLE